MPPFPPGDTMKLSTKAKQCAKDKAYFDDLVKQICLKRDGEKCRRCGRIDQLQASHIWPKGSHQKMRFDPDNVLILCEKCHLFWWHRNPIEAHEWLRIVLPNAVYDRLKLRSQYADRSKQDFNLIELDLKQTLRNLD